MSVILFGGSFDPFHNGHLAMAQAAKTAFPAARLVIVPAARSPFKGHLAPAANHHRLAMCRLGAQALQAEVSDWEMQAGGPSYTVRTVRSFLQAQPDEYWFLCGADSFVTLPMWREYETLLALTGFLVACRNDTPALRLQAAAEQVRRQGGRVQLLAMPPVPVSSTAVRAAARAGEDVSAFVPAPVARYIQENKLYQE